MEIRCSYAARRDVLEEPVSRSAKRVLFVCLGNSCRSQMAEAFAHAYGSDVIIPASAGFTPASRLAPDTIRAMAAKNLDLENHFQKASSTSAKRTLMS